MRALIVALACLLPLSACLQTGVVFPQLEGETLEGNTVVLPNDKNDKLTIVALAYSKKSEDLLKTWYTPMYDKFVLQRGIFDHLYDVHLFMIPMYTGAKKMAYDATMNQLRDSHRQDLFPYLLFYKGDIDRFVDVLHMDDKTQPYLFIIDEDGAVIYHTRGLFTEKKMEEIERVLDERLR